MSLEIIRKFRSNAEAIREAKRALNELQGRVPDAQLETCQVLVTGLVTNSVQHAKLDPQDEIILTVKVSSEVLRAEVCDPGPDFEVSSEKYKPAMEESSG